MVSWAVCVDNPWQFLLVKKKNEILLYTSRRYLYIHGVWFDDGSGFVVVFRHYRIITIFFIYYFFKIGKII